VPSGPAPACVLGILRRVYPRMSRNPLFRIFTTRLPRFVAVASLALVAFVATPSSGGPPVTRYDSLPQAGEKLTQSIWLPHCGMKVVEWRTTAALKAETTATEQAITILDDTCRDAFEKYASFLRSKKLPRLRDQATTLPTISLLPGNVLLDGKSLRALNDLPSRFEAVAPGLLLLGPLRRLAQPPLPAQRPAHQGRGRQARAEPALRADADPRDSPTS